MELVDSHCHIDFATFDYDRKVILSRCLELGIKNIIVPATTADRWKILINLCQTSSMLHPALGLHPMFLDEHHAEHLVTLERLLSQHSVVAVGEIGLDFYIKDHDKDAQIELVTAQLKLAQKYDLPVILHVRKAHDQMIVLLKQYPVKAGVVHAFSGSSHHADMYQRLGMSFGIGGAYSYTSATRLHNLIRELPLDRIVLETDAPDMPLQGKQGQRNSPEYITVIADVVGKLRQLQPEEIARITTENCKRLFNI